MPGCELHEDTALHERFLNECCRMKTTPENVRPELDPQIC